MLDFNKIVKKLWNKWWNVIFKKDIFEFIDPEYKKENQTKLNKLIYRLRSEWHLISLKSWVYIVPNQQDRESNSIDLIEKYYLTLLKKYIVQEVWSQYYISWLKSLEFHMKDQSIPDRICIMNRSINKKIKVWNYEIIFKTLAWKYQWKKLNLFSRFSGYTKEQVIDGIAFKTSNLELALVESALVQDSYEGLDISPLMKAMKKYWNIMDHEVFKQVGKYKYNMSFNRLKEVSKTINVELYKTFLGIIKENWWCFVWEWLRWI